MIEVYFGSNDFAIRRQLSAKTEKFLADFGELGIERVDGEEADFDKINQAITSLPFLANKKLVVFKNPSKNKTFLEHYETILTDLPETTELVLVDPAIDKRTAFYKYLMKNADCQEFKDLDEAALAKWLVTTSAELGGKISSGDAHFMVDRAGGNQQLLANELDKLLAYDAAISRATIELLVEPTPQSKIFDLLDAVFNGNPKRANQLYLDQRAQQVAPQQIIAMLNWQLKMIALAKTSQAGSPEELARDLSIRPFAAQKTWRLSQAIRLIDLKRYIRQLVELDTALKSKSLDADAALGQYLLSLAIN